MINYEVWINYKLWKWPAEIEYFCSESIWCVKKNIQAIAVDYLSSNIYNTIGRVVSNIYDCESYTSDEIDS